MSKRYPQKYLIGLTGNIAVGKSLVRQMLEGWGAATIDADRVAHAVMRKGEGTYADIVAAFGEGILGPDGEIARSALAAIVFADPAKLKRLEAITHPAVRREIDRMIQAAAQPIIVIEAIKLLEGDLKQAVDAVWVVNASPRTQLRRLRHERGMTAAEAKSRMAPQNSQAEKLRQADVVIENEGDIEALRTQVTQAWQKLTTEITEGTEKNV